MKIKHITVENYKAIERLDIDCCEHVNAFIGDNGAGKSTILEVILLLYSWMNARLSSAHGRGRSILKEDVRKGSDYCFLYIEVEHKGAQAAWSLFRGTPQAAYPEKQTSLKQLEPFIQHIRSTHENERYFMAFYGVNRNVSSVPVSINLYGNRYGKDAGLVNSRSVFANVSWRPFFNWLYERENEENRMKVKFNLQYHDESLDAVRECLQEVFPKYRSLQIKDRPTRFVIEKEGAEISFERLSDGEKCYITLVLDIARRLSLQNDGLRPILETEQIILIDEVDLHLHPSWQLQVISNLEQKFPNCQFFVTSHSSLVLSGLSEQDQLIVLRDGRNVALSDIPYGDNGDYILKRFFGLDTVRNPKVQEEIDFLSEEISKPHPDVDIIERKLDELSRKGIQFDESVKMRLALAKLKKANEKN